MKRLVALFVSLSAVDIALTLHFVGNGTASEINPVMARVLELPLPAILAYKMLVPLVLGAALIWLDKLPVARIARPRAILKLSVVILAGVCMFNLCGLLF